MTIFRVQHNKNYTVINNTICSDPTLSWKAKGIWLYAFSRMDDWQFNLTDLINRSTDGKESIRAGLKELENAGYLIRIQTRENGKYGHADWQFFETPQLKKIVPKTENPSTAKKSTENPPLVSTEKQVSTEEKQQQTTPSKPAASVVVFSVEIQKELHKLGKVSSKDLKAWRAAYTDQQIVTALKVTWEEERESPLAFFRRALEESWKPNKDRKTQKEAIKEHFKHGEEYNGAQCWVTPDDIGFTRGMKQGGVRFDEYSFITKFKHMLESFQIAWPWPKQPVA